MYQSLFPSEDYDSAYDIDFYAYYNKGYRGILFDVDNTLVEHGQPVTIRAIELFARLREAGFKTCIISNNKEYRVKPLADALESYYVYKAGKPAARGYIEGMEHMGTSGSTTLFVGDQIFTDILGANRAGIHSILVKPVAKHEEIQIVLKRKLEYFILKKYNKEKLKKAKA
ncbi:MAG: YqeG family HAD IIIA-type phosphatase [Lachnospiraceae bacterium]|jgi:HAD superfamily (subfamily IIIA) phosphatase, TIGR01668|nr:YqeG family HAD IIIA-type phosphatase [Lachnospiraceae bacterium]